MLRKSSIIALGDWEGIGKRGRIPRHVLRTAEQEEVDQPSENLNKEEPLVCEGPKEMGLRGENQHHRFKTVISGEDV